MNQAQQFEADKQLTPMDAAKLLGFSYQLWSQLKNGTRKLQQYHLNSIEAHSLLNKKQLKALIENRLKKD